MILILNIDFTKSIRWKWKYLK